MVRGEARGLGTGNPGREGTASREGKCISPSPGAGPGWIICCFKNLNTKRLSLSLGPKRAWRVMDGSTPDHTHPPSRQQATVGGSGESSKALLTHPLPNYGNQVSVHRTLRPLLGPPRARSLHSTSLPYRGYVSGPAGPTCMVSGCRELPSHLAGSCGLSDSAMRFSLPGVLSSSGASTSQQ